MELSRTFYSLAFSSKLDEWRNTYQVDSLSDRCWYQLIQHYNNYYNKRQGNPVRGRKHTMASRNVYWSIPQDYIKSNLLGKLHQNPGYDGYDPSVEMWTNWQNAVADEDFTN